MTASEVGRNPEIMRLRDLCRELERRAKKAEAERGQVLKDASAAVANALAREKKAEAELEAQEPRDGLREAAEALLRSVDAGMIGGVHVTDIRNNATRLHAALAESLDGLSGAASQPEHGTSGASTGGKESQGRQFGVPSGPAESEETFDSPEDRDEE